MLELEICPYCQGSGVKLVQVAKLFGLMKKEVPVSCDECSGTGKIVSLAECPYCEGQGLIGNEREICRACNGQGKIDTFGFIPINKLVPGTFFSRRCDQCRHDGFEIISGIEEKKLTRSWEKEEELRQVDFVKQVKVQCKQCGQTYHIRVNEAWHKPLTQEQVRQAEDIGLNLSFYH